MKRIIKNFRILTSEVCIYIPQKMQAFKQPSGISNKTPHHTQRIDNNIPKQANPKCNIWKERKYINLSKLWESVDIFLQLKNIFYHKKPYPLQHKIKWAFSNRLRILKQHQKVIFKTHQIIRKNSVNLHENINKAWKDIL
jgi:hypothetical protein